MIHHNPNQILPLHQLHHVIIGVIVIIVNRHHPVMILAEDAVGVMSMDAEITVVNLRVTSPLHLVTIVVMGVV